LHSEAYNIVLHYHTSSESALILCQELNQTRPDSAIGIQANLLDMNELQTLATQASKAWHGIDVLVNNAARFYPMPFAEVTAMHWNELMDCNLKAPFFLSQMLAKTLTTNKGSIVNISDIHAERGLINYPVYSLAKSGLSAMTKILAKEMGPSVRVNAVAPGAILWPEADKSNQEKQAILQRVVLQRKGEPEDIARAVLFLVSNAAYMTGQILTVDGGRTLFS
jgi:pteridine reductase